MVSVYTQNGNLYATGPELTRLIDEIAAHDATLLESLSHH